MDNIFPDLARGASSGVIRGLELARIRRDRREGNRRQRIQEATLTTLQNNIAASTFNPDGTPRDQNDVINDQIQLLTEASVDPNLDNDNRALIGGQLRQLSTNRSNAANVAPRGNNIPTGSSIAQAFGSSQVTNPAQPVDLGLNTPVAGAVATPTGQPTQAAAAQPATTTSRRDALRNANGAVAPTTGGTARPDLTAPALRAEPIPQAAAPVPFSERPSTIDVTDGNGNVVAQGVPTLAGIRRAFESVETQNVTDREGNTIFSGVPSIFLGGSSNAQPTQPAPNTSVRGDLRSRADSATQPTAQRSSRRVQTPSGRTAIVNTAIENNVVIDRIVSASERLVGEDGTIGGLSASSVQELVSLFENRLLQIGVDPSNLTPQQFDELLNSGQLLTLS